MAEYRSSEGKTVEVPYRGPVDAVILDLLGGLRSACTYIGAATIKEMARRTTFIRVTQQLNQVCNGDDTCHAADWANPKSMRRACDCRIGALRDVSNGHMPLAR